MIHYHGTPCGGTRESAAKFLAGRSALVSFARPEDLGVALEVCDSVILDNGAYTEWKRGVVFRGGDYVEWVQEVENHPAVAWALIPDIIDGTERDNDDFLLRWGRCLKNGVPVYHLHETLERAERLARTYPVVAIGSSGKWPNPGTEGWWRRISEVMAVMCDEQGRPRCKLHGLRMLNPAIFHRLPLASADSTNAVQNGVPSRFGMYPPPTSGQRSAVIADRIESHQSAAVWLPLEDQATLFTLES